MASVYQCWIKSLRRVLDEVEEKWVVFTALPAKLGHSRLADWKTIVPNWKDVMRSFIGMVQGGVTDKIRVCETCTPLYSILRWSNELSGSWPPQVVFWSQKNADIFQLMGFNSTKNYLLCVSLRQNQYPAPRLAVSSWLSFPHLWIPSLHGLAAIWICLFGTQGRSWKLESVPTRKRQPQICSACKWLPGVSSAYMF